MAELIGPESPHLNGRIPYRLVKEQGEVRFKWLYVGDKPFTEPFFDETIGKCLSLPENSFQAQPLTSAETLVEVAASADSVEPTALIFHISRCGSTLLTQMLAQDERFVVLPEVSLIDELLQMKSEDEVIRAAVKVMSQKRRGPEAALFVKLDSWHVMFFDRLRKLYPLTPAFLISRDRDQVVRSHKRMPGRHAVKGVLDPAIFGFSEAELAQMRAEDYLPAVLDRYEAAYRNILEHDPLVFTLSYHDGPMEMLRKVLEKTGLSVDPETLERMRARTLTHSKRPDQPFVGDEPIP